MRDDRVLDSDADAVFDEAGDGIEAGFQVGSEVVLLFQIDDEGRTAGSGEVAESGFKSGGIAGIGTGQMHDRGKVIAAEDGRLIDEAAVGRTGARDGPVGVIEAVEPT